MKKTNKALNIISKVCLIFIIVFLLLNTVKFMQFNKIFLMVIALSIITIYRTEFGILALVFFSPLLLKIPKELGIFQFSMIELFFMVVFSIWIIKSIIKKKEFIKTPLDKPIIIFLATLILSQVRPLISAISSTSFTIFIQKSFNLLILQPYDSFFFLYILFNIFEVIALYYLIVNNITTKKQVNQILVALFASVSIIALFGIKYIISNTWPPGISFFDANDLGGYLTLIVPLSISLFLFGLKQYKKYLFGIVMFLSIFTLIISKTSGAWFGVFVGTIYLLYLKRKETIVFVKKRKTLLLSILALIIILILIPQVRYKIEKNYYVGEVLGNFNKDSYNGIASGRTEYWGNAIDLIKQYPLTGAGFGSYMKINQVWYRDYTYNYYLLIFAEAGFFAFAALLYLLYNIFRHSKDIIKKTKDNYMKAILIGSIASITATLAHSLFQHHLIYPEILFIFWINIALIITISKLEYQDNKKYLNKINKRKI